MQRVVGLDLGQSGDPAAAAVVELGGGLLTKQEKDAWMVWDDDAERWATVQQWKKRGDADKWIADSGKRRIDDKLRCRTLRHWPLETGYCDVVRDVFDLPFHAVVPDYCGAGRPVVDFMVEEKARRRHTGKVMPVVTVASSARAKQKLGRVDHYSVPKVDLVAAITVAQETKRLVLPDPQQVPETTMLLEELGSYRRRYSQAANLEFGNAPGKGKHDDLVTALGLALWYLKTFGVRHLSVYMG